MPALYLVATPIGNLEDITLRALRTLREVGLIAAEDTRKARVLLQHYQIRTPVTSYHEHNKTTKLPYLMAQLREKDIALISEAGMPGISDPGYELVKAALEEGFPVVPIPGPSVVTAALASSGLPSYQFLFLGFLPRKKGERKRLLSSLVNEPRTVVAFEAPHRLRATLADIAETLGDRPLALCRELTKLHEEVFRGSARQALEYFPEPRGEFTLVIQGGEATKKSASFDSLKERLQYLIGQGLPPKEAILHVAGETGCPRKEVYKTWLQLARRDGKTSR